MLGTPPPSSPTVDTVSRQQNQLLSKPGGSTTTPSQLNPIGRAVSTPFDPTGSSIFPNINSQLSQSPLLQQSDNKIQSMIQALMGRQGAM